jgi:hypothetical protein
MQSAHHQPLRPEQHASYQVIPGWQSAVEVQLRPVTCARFAVKGQYDE